MVARFSASGGAACSRGDRCACCAECRRARPRAPLRRHGPVIRVRTACSAALDGQACSVARAAAVAHDHSSAGAVGAELARTSGGTPDARPPRHVAVVEAAHRPRSPAVEGRRTPTSSRRPFELCTRRRTTRPKGPKERSRTSFVTSDVLSSLF